MTGDVSRETGHALTGRISGATGIASFCQCGRSFFGADVGQADGRFTDHISDLPLHAGAVAIDDDGMVWKLWSFGTEPPKWWPLPMSLLIGAETRSIPRERADVPGVIVHRGGRP